MERLVIKVIDIKGKCPIYKIGDKIIIEGPEVKLDETDALCIHAFASLLPYIIAFRKGVKPSEIGLGDEKKAYVHCPDPGPPYTPGGTVTFEITVVRDEAEKGLENSEGGHRGS
ncbi:TIGR04076 family protein [Pyrococcus abyssi]|uniref:TIGR04076 family protein n=1 Tax=Pyrococcus abyssi (strain GE5 / Orsay) TaxID=272844 RepID=Q9UYW4_PYRAB|nr:TIGR04076 family protein [Pyrococcus abyssi]CAB50298.1 Hypothetical protein PAB0921 [Pyrococcus abyssi GE5]CCE70836.1 TPA: hypothetical protein PAB0921 [Pyrococcus abyssi GE5]